MFLIYFEPANRIPTQIRFKAEISYVVERGSSPITFLVDERPHREAAN
ncbi:MAG: hypothetical protein JWM99_1992 [Verrucomicrobiales bacterium]|nr:hypothetical protein [Verrucomicrobiales bacterium]